MRYSKPQMPSSSRIEAAVERSALIRGALSVARRAHAAQVRETGNGEVAFIEHPVAVAERLLDEDYPCEIVAAGLLHDVAEHAETAPEALRGRFGDQVAELVATLTEDVTIESYEERKDEHRERVAAAGAPARAIFAADKTANVATLRAAYAEEGEDVDVGLPVSLDLKILVWEFDLEMLFENDDGLPLVDRFADEMVALWGQRAQNDRAYLC